MMVYVCDVCEAQITIQPAEGLMPVAVRCNGKRDLDTVEDHGEMRLLEFDREVQ